MNRTTTVAVALIFAAGLTTIIYAVPGTAQKAFAWGHRVVHHDSYQSYPVPYPVPYPVFGGCGWGGGCGFGGCGLGICGGGFFSGSGLGICGGGFFSGSAEEDIVCLRIHT
jgi:hypothetical protein